MLKQIRLKTWVILLIGLFGWGWSAWAAEGSEPESVAPLESSDSTEFQSGDSEPPPPVHQKTKGAYSAEKAEGSKALNRFEADIVSKSYYRNSTGEPLEVDPD